MTSTLKVIEILEPAQIEAPRARAIAAAIEEAISRNEQSLREVLATKVDLKDLEMRLTERIENQKSDMVRWMFMFWIGQTAVLGGLIKLLLR